MMKFCGLWTAVSPRNETEVDWHLPHSDFHLATARNLMIIYAVLNCLFPMFKGYRVWIRCWLVFFEARYFEASLCLKVTTSWTQWKDSLQDYFKPQGEGSSNRDWFQLHISNNPNNSDLYKTGVIILSNNKEVLISSPSLMEQFKGVKINICNLGVFSYCQL